MKASGEKHPNLHPNPQRILDCLEESKSDIRNIRAYLMTALYNAPTTMDGYYAAKVNHDMG